MIVKGVFLIFLFMTAWSDWRSGQIPRWMFRVGGVAAVLLFLIIPDTIWWYRPAGMVLGVVLLAIGKCSGWALGAGDGWFFLISGLMLGVVRNILLLSGGMLLCGLYCLSLCVWGNVAGEKVGVWKIPFLPFLVPAGIGLVLFTG